MHQTLRLTDGVYLLHVRLMGKMDILDEDGKAVLFHGGL